MCACSLSALLLMAQRAMQPDCSLMSEQRAKRESCMSLSHSPASVCDVLLCPVLALSVLMSCSASVTLSCSSQNHMEQSEMAERAKSKESRETCSSLS